MEVRIHFQGAEDPEVQVVQVAAPPEGIGVIRVVDLVDTGAAGDGLGGYGIEGLATGNGPDQTGSTDNANQPGNNSAPANPRANPAPPAQ